MVVKAIPRSPDRKIKLDKRETRGIIRYILGGIQMQPTLTRNASILRSTITYLNSNGVTDHVGLPRANRREYNCWGFTRGILDTQAGFEWEDMDEMEDWLSEKTTEINMHKERLKCGDIVVFRGVDEDECYCGIYDDEGAEVGCTCEPELLHTAILVDPVKMIIIHKPGGQALERCTVEIALEENPCYGEVTEYRRVNKCGQES